MDIHTTTIIGKAWVSAESADDAVRIVNALNSQFEKNDFYAIQFDTAHMDVQTDDEETTVICPVSGSGRENFCNRITKFGEACNENSFLESQTWSLIFELYEENIDRKYITHGWFEMHHEAEQLLKSCRMEEFWHSDFNRDVYTVSHFLDYTQKQIEDSFQLGKNHVNNFSSPVSYEIHRLECLKDAVNSYVFFGHWTMSSKKAEIRILALFPCLRKINTEN